MDLESATPKTLTGRPWVGELATSDAALRPVLFGLPGVDQVGAESRTGSLATRWIKRDAKLWAPTRPSR